MALERKHPRTLLVVLNPLCGGSADPGSGRPEPLLSAGPTELVAGFYLDGGPLRLRSEPKCERLGGEPGGGTITVTNPATGAALSTQTVASGHLATILLPAGTYTMTGVFADATINGQHATLSMTVVIQPQTTVHQDFVLNIP